MSRTKAILPALDQLVTVLAMFLHNLKQLAIAVDQFFNVALCFFLRERAWADETLSSHCWRWEKDGVRAWPRKLVDRLALLFGDTDHCYESYESERLGKQLPPVFRP